MTKVMAVTIQKGGAGKSSTAANLTIELAHTGSKVLLVDLDPQANGTKVISAGNYDHAITTAELLGKTPPPVEDAIKQSPHHPNAYYIPSALRLITSLDLLMTRNFRESILQKLLSRVKGFDYIIIDTQPNAQIGTQNAIVAAEHLLIPIDGGFSLDGLSDLLQLVNEIKAGETWHPWILKNKVSAAKKVMGRFIDEELQPYADHVLSTVIRVDEAIEQANTSAIPVRLFKPNSRGATDYAALASELKGKIND